MSSSSLSSFSSSSYIENWSSSSSSGQIMIVLPLINQNNGDLIPFSWVAENGVAGDGSILNFTIESSSSPYFDYSAIINRNNGALTTAPSTTSTVYVPNQEESKYEHKKSFYVDVIAKDASGIREVRTHVGPNKYEFKDVSEAGQTFNIPKFTILSTNATSTVTTETVLIGTSTNALINVEYSTNSASIVDLVDLGSSVDGIMYGEGTNKAYISTSSNLYSYSINYYANSSSEVCSNLSVTNTDGAIMSAYRKADDSLWAIQSYNGKVAKMSPSDLSVIKTYEEFDSPHKIRYSAFHNAYFVGGSNVLWEIDSTDIVTSVYEINDYTLRDFDVSETGLICMLFRGKTDDIIRIVSGNLYTFVLDKRVGAGTVAFCRYCGKGKFYILVELSTGSDVYSAVHYVFNSSTNKLDSVSSDQATLVTTTTTTPGNTTKAVKVSSPNGGEKIQIGQQYDIQWISSKGINDFVKIELYKAAVLYDVLTEKTSNTGIFSWNVSTGIEDGEDYKIKITWLSNSTDSNNYDSSAGVFSILKAVTTTTTTTTTRMTLHAIGIDYSSASDQILIVLASGLYMVFVLPTLTAYGLLSLGVSNPAVIATRSMVISGQGKQTKFRIFVGSQMYLSDRWDSGIIESDLKSCWYGGGNNLVPGGNYYAHIQVYLENEGWSEIQIGQFVLPK